MMQVKNKPIGLSSINGGSTGDGGESGPVEWELRPGGMLVQIRDPDSDRSSVPTPTIRVKVKFGSIYHEIYISSQATFGESKKMLTGPTGLHHQDQKLLFKDKEMDSNAYLDRIASQVSAFESIISKGGKVAEKEVLNLTELLMNQLINLDV